MFLINCLKILEHGLNSQFRKLGQKFTEPQIGSNWKLYVALIENTSLKCDFLFYQNSFTKRRGINQLFFFYLQQTLEKSRIGWWITRHPKISWQLERCKTSVKASRLDLMRRNQWRFLLVQLLKTILNCRQLKFEVVFSFSPFILMR